MSDDYIQSFVQQIMDINVTTLSGFGTIRSGEQPVNQLKQTTLAFASEYKKTSPDRDLLEKLGDEIYALLKTLQVMSVLGKDRYALLNTDLDKLIKK